MSNVKGTSVRISQLSAVSGVPTATIKFYLREKLLHGGRLTSATQADYDDEHVARLRLVRALLGPGGLSVAAARQVLAAVDEPPAEMHQLLGIAQGAVNATAPPTGVDLQRTRELLREWGWDVEHTDPASQARLAEALEGVAAAGFEVPAGLLTACASAMRGIAELEIAAVPTASTAAAVRYVVLGTVLVEPLLLALRRLAEQELSFQRFGTGGGPARTR
jgi:DNA-binding transcriptional MerR regulator